MTEGALSRHTAERLIEAAIAAPSLHNSQPWRFVARLSDRVIEVYADPARTLRRGDPRGRGVHFACGSALFNLRLAIAQAGYEPVARLLPSPRNPLLLATVRLAGPYRPCPAERELYEAIGRQPAGRASAAGGHSLLRGLLASLREAAALEGATLRLLDHTDALHVLRRSAAADPELRANPAYLAELAAWTGGLRQSHRLYNAQPRLTPAGGKAGADGRLLMRDFSPRPGGHPLPQALLDAATQVAVISTSADDRASWLRAGQAAQRVLLLATHRGLQTAILTQVLEEQETLRTDPCLNGEFPATILRFGYSRQLPPAPRRPVGQVLRVIPPASLRQGMRHGQNVLGQAGSLGQASSLGQDKGPGDGPPPALPSGDLHLMPSK